MIEKINWRITFNCNMRPYCNYCFMPHSKHFDGTSVQSISERILQFNPKMIVISGGEPLMCNGLNNLIKTFHANGIKVCLATNGILLLSKFPDFNEYVDTLTLPIDSLNYKCFRNIKAIDSVLQILEHIRNTNSCCLKKPRLIINTVLYGQTFDELMSIAKFITNYDVDVWKVFEYMHYKGVNENRSPLTLRYDEIEKLKTTFNSGHLSYEDSANKDSRYFIVNPDGRVVLPVNIGNNIFIDKELGSISDDISQIEGKWHQVVNSYNYKQSNLLLKV